MKIIAYIKNKKVVTKPITKKTTSILNSLSPSEQNTLDTIIQNIIRSNKPISIKIDKKKFKDLIRSPQQKTNPNVETDPTIIKYIESLDQIKSQNYLISNNIIPSDFLEKHATKLHTDNLNNKIIPLTSHEDIKKLVKIYKKHNEKLLLVIDKLNQVRQIPNNINAEIITKNVKLWQKLVENKKISFISTDKKVLNLINKNIKKNINISLCSLVQLLVIAKIKPNQDILKSITKEQFEAMTNSRYKKEIEKLATAAGNKQGFISRGLNL